MSQNLKLYPGLSIRPYIKQAPNARLWELLDSEDEDENTEAHNELVLRLGGWLYLPTGLHIWVDKPE